MLAHEHNKFKKELSQRRAPVFNELCKLLPEPNEAFKNEAPKNRGISAQVVRDNMRQIPIGLDDIHGVIKQLERTFPRTVLADLGFTPTMEMGADEDDNGDDEDVRPRIPGSVFNWLAWNRGAAVFVYRDAAGRTVSLRVHKKHIKTGYIMPFIPKHEVSDTVLVVEGEYKALAVLEYGRFPIALNGLGSFTGVHFPELTASIKSLSSPTAVVYLVLDHEFKFKWAGGNGNTGPVQTLELGFMLQDAGFDVRIGLLPYEYRKEGPDGWKVDWDDARSKGMTGADVAKVLDAAVVPAHFIEALRDELKIEISRRAPLIRSANFAKTILKPTGENNV